MADVTSYGNGVTFNWLMARSCLSIVQTVPHAATALFLLPKHWLQAVKSDGNESSTLPFSLFLPISVYFYFPFILFCIFPILHSSHFSYLSVSIYIFNLIMHPFFFPFFYLFILLSFSFLCFISHSA